MTIFSHLLQFGWCNGISAGRLLGRSVLALEELRTHRHRHGLTALGSRDSTAEHVAPFKSLSPH